MKYTSLTKAPLVAALVFSCTAANAARGPDFDGDGYDDAAMGMPDKNIDGVTDAGNVLVSYGSAQGLTSEKGLNLLNRSATDIKGTPTDAARFGAALAWGDFNNDGHDDLIAGVPGDTVSGKTGTGSIQIFYGHAACQGLCNEIDVIVHRDSPGIVGSSEADVFFGAALAAGDFNGDGFDDVAIGVPGDTVRRRTQRKFGAGSIHVIYGSPKGIHADATVMNHVLHLDLQHAVPNNLPAAQAGSGYGQVLTAGDFNCDGVDDIAVGIPEYTVADQARAGAVHVVYGSVTGGLNFQSSPGAWLWTQGFLLADAAEENDRFGFSLASGNFNDDFAGSNNPVACVDLAIGIPFETYDDPDVGPAPGAGAMQVIYGNPLGLIATGSQFWHKGSIAKIAPVYTDENFGWDLVAADFNHDHRDDLMIGEIGAGFSGEPGEGAVAFLRGGNTGLSDDMYNAFSQGDNFVMGNPESGDFLGYRLGGGNFDGTGGDELLASSPFDNYDDGVEQGIVQELHFETLEINGKTVLLTSAPSAGWIYDACAALDFQCKGVGEALGEHEQHFAMALTKPRP